MDGKTDHETLEARDTVVNAPPVSPPPPLSTAAVLGRVAFAVLLVAAGLWLAWFLFRTPTGAQLRDRHFVHAWVRHHRFIAPAIVVTAFVILGVSCFPVWPAQLIAGYCFGLAWGILWSEMGAVSASVLGVAISRWMFAGWVQRRYESRMDKLHMLNERLGHNGLLVVMALRLAHVLPFGISNYLLGLTRITLLDVAIGTACGNLPAISVYVCAGVGRHVLMNWRTWVVLGAVDLLMMTPLALRYLRPHWFRKIGVE